MNRIINAILGFKYKQVYDCYYVRFGYIGNNEVYLKRTEDSSYLKTTTDLTEARCTSDKELIQVYMEINYPNNIRYDIVKKTTFLN